MKDKMGNDMPLQRKLAHELSQPLMVISAYASGCIRRLEEDVYDKKQIIDAMKEVNHQVERAGKLIHDMKDDAAFEINAADIKFLMLYLLLREY